MSDIDRNAVEIRRWIAESDKFVAEQRKLMSESTKLESERRKFDREPLTTLISTIAAALAAGAGLLIVLAKIMGWQL